MTTLAIIAAIVASLWLIVQLDDRDDDYLIANPWKDDL